VVRSSLLLGRGCSCCAAELIASFTGMATLDWGRCHPLPRPGDAGAWPRLFPQFAHATRVARASASRLVSA